MKPLQRGITGQPPRTRSSWPPQRAARLSQHLLVWPARPGKTANMQNESGKTSLKSPVERALVLAAPASSRHGVGVPIEGEKIRDLAPRGTVRLVPIPRRKCDETITL